MPSQGFFKRKETEMATQNKQGSTVEFLQKNSGTVEDTQAAPAPAHAGGQVRDFVPGVDSALAQRKGPKAARPTGKAGEPAESAPEV